MEDMKKEQFEFHLQQGEGFNLEFIENSEKVRRKYGKNIY